MFCDLPTCISDLVCLFAYDATLAETKTSLDICSSLLEDIGSHVILKSMCSDYTHSPSWVYCRDTMQTYDHYTFHMWTLNTRPAVNPLYNFYVWFSIRDLFAYTHVHQLIDDFDWRKVRGLLPRPMCRTDYIRCVNRSLDYLLAFSHLLFVLDKTHQRQMSSRYTKYILGPSVHNWPT